MKKIYQLLPSEIRKISKPILIQRIDKEKKQLALQIAKHERSYTGRKKGDRYSQRLRAINRRIAKLNAVKQNFCIGN